MVDLANRVAKGTPIDPADPGMGIRPWTHAEVHIALTEITHGTSVDSPVSFVDTATQFAKTCTRGMAFVEELGSGVPSSVVVHSEATPATESTVEELTGRKATWPFEDTRGCRNEEGGSMRGT